MWVKLTFSSSNVIWTYSPWLIWGYSFSRKLETCINKDIWAMMSYEWLVIEVHLKRQDLSDSPFGKQSVGLNCGPIMEEEVPIISYSWVPESEHSVVPQALPHIHLHLSSEASGFSALFCPSCILSQNLSLWKVVVDSDSFTEGVGSWHLTSTML